MKNIQARESVCCFTGHRPHKLKKSEEEVKIALSRAVADAFSDGYRTFISGMAEGTDVWASELILEMKKQHPDVRLVCALPHYGFENGRSFSEKERYRRILRQADRIFVLSTHYRKGCYRIRNRFMVDNASLVIAVCNGSASGTKSTVDYARAKGIRVVSAAE